MLDDMTHLSATISYPSGSTELALRDVMSATTTAATSELRVINWSRLQMTPLW
jgi:hypothetical protein